MTFAADQTYSDGTVVNWNELTKAGAAEPEHPAPSRHSLFFGPDRVHHVEHLRWTARGLGIAGIAVASPV